MARGKAMHGLFTLLTLLNLLILFTLFTLLIRSRVEPARLSPVLE